MTEAAVRRMNAISEHGFCIGCGLCEAIAGPDQIRVAKNQTEDLRPIVQGDLDDQVVDAIYDLCPGVHVRGMPERLAPADAVNDPIWGVWARMTRAYAGDPQIRHEGSTGGVLTALASYLLTSQRVAFVLHTKASESDPAFGEATLSFTPDDVRAAAGSRYGPTATLLDIESVLARGEPFAFIGKPCDIGALRNLARRDDRVDALTRYWLTPICGGFMPTPARIETVRRLAGVEPEALKGLRYRGFGCPGSTRIASDAGVRELHYLDFWGEDSSQWSLPFRCKICPDGIGESADIAAADSWPGGAPDREESKTDPGVNAMIARTAAGVELLEAAERDGAIKVEREIGPPEMSGYQPHQVRKKHVVAPRLKGLADAGLVPPRYLGLRLDGLATELSPEDYEAQRTGAAQRIRNGKVREETPRATEG